MLSAQTLAKASATLDPSDDDPTRLWTYVSHAVDRLRPGLARPALASLRTPKSNVETAIDELLNGLAGYDGRAIIYGKLGVRSRDEAVRRASVLGLIGQGDSPG